MKKLYSCGAALFALLLAAFPLRAAAPLDAEVTGLWVEVGGVPDPVDAEYEASDSGEIIYTRTLKDGKTFLSVERRPSVDGDGNAAATQQTGNLLSKIEGVKKTDLMSLPGVERLEERYGYPCVGVVYPGGRNGEASRNADMLMFAKQWVFRIHVSATSEADMDEEQAMKWFSDLKLTERAPANCIELADAGENKAQAMAPVPLVAIAYTGENFQGMEWKISEAEDYDLRDTFDLPNDSIRSVRVRPGSAIILYEHAELEGKSLTLEADTSDLGSWNGQASSLKAVSYWDGDEPKVSAWLRASSEVEKRFASSSMDEEQLKNALRTLKTAERITFFIGAHNFQWYGGRSDESRLAMGGELLDIFKTLGYDVSAWTPNSFTQQMNNFYDWRNDWTIWTIACAILNVDGEMLQGMLSGL